MSRSSALRRVGIALSLVLLLVLTGCGTTGTIARLPLPTITTTPPPEAVWTVDGVPWTEPQQVGDVVVLGLLYRDLPYLTGLDAATGRKLWAHPMSPSAVLRGMSMDFQVRDGIVEFLEGSKRPSTMEATLTSVRASTGEVIARTEAKQFDSYPDECDHDQQQTCVSSDGVTLQLSKDRRSLSKVSSPASADLKWMQDIGPYGLVRYLERSGAVGLASVEGATVRWKVTEQEAFGPGFSTNGGWTFQKLDQPKYVIGSVGAYTEAELPDDRVVDRSTRSTTVAIDARTGEVVWRREGVGTWCLDGVDDDLDVVIACGEGGTLVYQDKRFRRWKEPRRSLEAIDPRTGDVRWWVAWQPHASSIPDIGAEPARITDTTLLARGPEPLVIDVTTGDVRPAGPDDIGWCETADAQTEYPVGAPSGDTIWGTKAHRSCDGSKDDVDAMPSAIPEAVGLRVGDLAVVLHQDRVTAYRVTR